MNRPYNRFSTEVLKGVGLFCLCILIGTIFYSMEPPQPNKLTQDQQITQLEHRLTQLEQENEELKLAIGITADYHNAFVNDMVDYRMERDKHTFDWMGFCTRECH